MISGQKIDTVISVDIGSTFTKGAVFRITPDAPAVLDRAGVPTSVDDLSVCMTHVLRMLTGKKNSGLRELAEGRAVYFSSSAKGGLRIAALGLVPELTLEAARLTAWSAGAKICGNFAFKLTKEDLRCLEAMAPDILLFAGGTEGGNESMVLHNAEALARSAYDGVVIYAGNRAVLDKVAQILVGKKIMFAPNLMPEIGKFNPDPAREIVREVFLKEIVRGRGLGGIVDAINRNPKPTPLGVFELVQQLAQVGRDWRSFCMIDLGGATTDFYSNCPTPRESQIVDKGLDEPKVKRTVEGDLGLRVSASALWASQQKIILDEAIRIGLEQGFVKDYAAKVAAQPEYIAAGSRELAVDRLFARACMAQAMFRHAGRIREVFTASGKVFVRHGKDIRKVDRLIGTGGFLANCATGAIYRNLGLEAHCEGDEQILLPGAMMCFRDKNYIIPILGAIVADYPEQAAQMALDNLEQLKEL